MMRPSATLTTPGPDALKGLLARSQPAHDGCGYLCNGCPVPETGVVLLRGSSPRRNLVGLRPDPSFSRLYVDDLTHLIPAPVVSILRHGWINDTWMGHAESYSSRGESHFDRGDGPNVCE